MLKTNGNIQEILAVLIKGEIEIKKALATGWISIFKQGRNSNGKPRPPKYQTHLEKIPLENTVKIQ